MHLVLRTFVRVRAMLFGSPKPHLSAHDPALEPALEPAAAPASAPSLPVNPSPETWAPFLASARRRRDQTPCLWPRTELPEITAEDIASTLVGAYVLTPEMRQRIRQARQFAEVS